MEIVSKSGDPKFAEVYVAKVRDEPRSLIEFVDAVDPRYPKDEKWVIIVSTQIGCPVGCLMCDSGAYFYGNLTKDEIFAQIDYVLNRSDVLASMRPDVKRRHANTPVRQDGLLNHPKLKIQFARMGEPSLNPAVLDVLEELPARYQIKGLMPCIATTAPKAAVNWFRHLIEIKERLYSGGRFQLQFSLNSTSEKERDALMPVKKWSLADIASFGELYFRGGDRKIALNFALTKEAEVEPSIIGKIFDPEKFIIKITPVNPTFASAANNFGTVISHDRPSDADHIKCALDKLGFDTIISIGVREEIEIGSNCGQIARREHYGTDSDKSYMEGR